MYYAANLKAFDPAQCEAAYTTWQAFDRLSKKTNDPKYDKQRPAAVSNATHWKNTYDQCMAAGQQEAAKVVQDQALVAQQQLTQALTPGVSVSAGASASPSWPRYLFWGTVAGLVIGGAYFLLRKRR